MENNSQGSIEGSKAVGQDLVESKSGLIVTIQNQMLIEMAAQRQALARFVKSELIVDVDFGIIPGTKKNSLWKPGAEKIANIFQLGSRIHSVEKIIDWKENIATFYITMEIFHIPSGKSIAHSEGVCSSREKKYFEREEYEWINNKKVSRGARQTPIGDLLNTLSKMAQKRGFISGVIMATAASDFFTMDIDENYEDGGLRWDGSPPIDTGKKEEEKEPPKLESTKNSGFEKPIPPPVVNVVDPRRAEFGALINAERVRLGWKAGDLNKFIMDTFGRESNKLSIEDLALTIEALKRTKVK